MVRLGPLMERTAGDPVVAIGLIDGPVVLDQPALATGHLREIGGRHAAHCASRSHPACVHGTFVAGILAARRGSGAPAICPDCTVYVRPIFSDRSAPRPIPTATPADLRDAILDCIAARARVINVSAAVSGASAGEESQVTDALNEAAKAEVIVVAATGNDGMIGSNALTRHPWVIPVTGHDLRGRPMSQSNHSRSTGQRGLGAPGEGVISIGTGSGLSTLHGTSFAAPFVTGTAALLWSQFPTATAVDIKAAMLAPGRRRSLIPPLLDAWAAFEAMHERNAHA